jgi:hypothetical protein
MELTHATIFFTQNCYQILPVNNFKLRRRSDDLAPVQAQKNPGDRDSLYYFKQSDHCFNSF